MSHKHSAIALLISSQLLWAAGTVSSARYGIELPVPDGWTPRTTDTSLSISSNQQFGTNTVVVGVQFFPSLAPYATAHDWREKTMNTFIQYLEANSGRLLTPNTKGVLNGDSTEDATYLGFEYKSGVLFAGYSRYLARDGHGYEMFVMGDTIPLYRNFPVYQAMLNSIRFVAAATAIPHRDARTFSVHRVSATRLAVDIDRDLGALDLVDLQGRPIPMTAVPLAGGGTEIILERQMPFPVVVRAGNMGRLVLP